MPADEHSVTLTVYSPSLTSAEMIAQIGVEPDEQWDRGQRTPSGYERTRSAVIYGSALTRQTAANEQISAVLARLAPAATCLARLARVPEGEVTLSIGYFVNEPQWQERGDDTLVRGLGVSLNSAQIELLHTMGAEFDVDFYVNVDGES